MYEMIDRWKNDLAINAHKKLIEWLTTNHRTIKTWLEVDVNNEFDQWQDDLATAMHKRWFGWVDDLFNYIKQGWGNLMNFMGIGVPGTGADFKRVPGGKVYPRIANDPLTPGGWRKAYEQYPWEGASSNYGPGGYLGVPNEIGLGSILQRQWGVYPGRKGTVSGWHCNVAQGHGD